MGNIYSVLYLVVFIAAGIAVSGRLLRDECALPRLMLGLCFALSMLLWLPALFSFLLSRFSLLSQLLALFAAAAVGAICFLRGPRPTWRFDRAELLRAFTVLPLFLVSLYILSTHTIVEKGGALWVGQSTYGDLSMHLGFITSIAEQQTFPPDYSICPGTPLGYPFLSDSVSSTFCLLGAPLRIAAMLPAILALFVVFFGAYCFFTGWLKTKRAGVLATYLAFLGGGFGFAYFFDLAKAEPGKLLNLLTAFYETPTNFVQNGLRWVNPIADMLIPQRATLFGWALLFPCLYLLYRAAFEKRTRCFPILGCLAGCLPLVHTHSFLALGVLSFVYLIYCFIENDRDLIKGFLLYGGIAVLLAAPQLFAFTFKQSESFLQLHWNWCNESDSFLWFYIKNLGLLFLLMPTAFLSLSNEDRWVFSGALLLWLIAETVQFQPNTYDNNKLLFVWFFLMCGIVAKWLVQTFSPLLCRSVPLGKRAGAYVLSAVLGGTLFLSGTLTLCREAVSEYMLIGPSEVEAAAYIQEHTAPDATFLTCNNHNNFVAVLTGRNIVCGSGTFLFFHGIDYAPREAALPLLYEEPGLYFDTLSAQYGVNYVVIGPYEQHAYSVDADYFAARFPVFYKSADGSVTIYEVM